MKYALIFCFGGLGSLVRYGISSWLGNHSSGFPLGTLVANLLSCAVFGLFLAWAQRAASLSPEYRFAILTGFCGGFSTFSTFSAETMGLMQQGQWLLAISYVAISVILGVGIVWLLA